MVSGDAAQTLAYVTPISVHFFESALKIAQNPDSVGMEQHSQMEVLLGFQARWLIDAGKRDEMTVPEFFAWSVQNGVVQLDALTKIDLSNVEVSGNHATAFMANGGIVLTNVSLSFERQAGVWRFDLNKLITGGDDTMEKVRLERRLKRPEMAVLILENMFRQPIPALREILLPPEARKEISRLRNASAQQVYDGAVLELSKGCQKDAEALLEVFVAVHTNDQRLAFLQAVCSRSRWSKQESERQFWTVLGMNPATPEANASRYILDLDERRNVAQNMDALRLLATEHPENPLFLWLMAMVCRDHYKLTGEQTYSVEASQCYRKLLTVWEVGPVLLHQTYANVLSEELNENEEALTHRRIAVKLEPASWNYQGLANTLSGMKRYAEANDAYAKLVELDPNDAMYWDCWANSLSYQNRYEECIEKCKKALAIDPSYFNSYNKWGHALEQLGNYDEAMEIFNKVIKINPTHEYAYDAQYRILIKTGKTNEASNVLRSKIHMQSRKKNPIGGQLNR